MNSSLTSALQYCSTHPELCFTREFQPGDLISLAGEEHGSFLLIRTGSIRFVDPSRTFSSLTLSIVEAPYLLDSSIFSGCELTEPVRAATCVSAYQVCISSLPIEVYTPLVHFWKSCLDPREWILIHQCLRSTQDQSSLASPLLDLPPSSLNLILKFYHQKIPCDKIGESLNKSGNSVRLMLTRIRKKLRKCCELRMKENEIK